MSKIHPFQKFRQIILDLFLVIIGVLIAFWLSNYQSQKETEAEREKILQLCKNELNRNLLEFTYGEMMYDSILNTFRAGVREKKEPPLVNRNIIMNYDLSIWNTAIDKGVLDSEEMFVIGRMKSAVKILQKYTDRLHDFNVTILIPNLDKGKEEFYTKEHILKNKYQWYVDNLSKVEFGMHELNKYCNQLQELLNKRK